MALQKQPASITFAQGLNTKTDKWQIPNGQFSALTNTVFDKAGLLQKRNGYGLLANAPAGSQTLSTLNDGLVVLGNTCQSYSSETNTLTNAGLFQPMHLSTATMVRRATGQLTADVAVASNGTACATWLDRDGNSYYQVLDSQTGQIIVPATALVSTATSSRAYALGGYFIVMYLATISSATHMQYVAIPINNPLAPLAPRDFSTVVGSLTSPFDGQVYNNRLYITYAASDVGGAVRTGILDAVLNSPTSAIIASVTATTVAVTVDVTNNNVWVAYSTAAGVISAACYNQGLIPILASTTVVSGYSSGIANLALSANNAVLTAIYEVFNTYGYAPNARTDYLATNTLTQAGVAGTASVVLRGVGLASRAIISNFSNTIVVLAAYGQAYQPTYMLIDIKGNVLARLAYSNGSGYLINNVLANLNQNGDVIQVGYLYADQLIPVNKDQGAPSATGVYAQYGINLASFSFGGQTDALEITGALHASGGMLWQYDGVRMREHGFNFWPEDIIAKIANINSVNSTYVGPGGGLAPGVQYYYQWVYEWTDAAGNVHRSAPSVPYLLDTTGYTAIGFNTSTGVGLGNQWAAGDTTIRLANVSGFHIGQTVVDMTTSAAFAANTTITAINAGASPPTITLSAATLLPSSPSTGDTVGGIGTSFVATFTANSLTLSVNTTSNLRVGQRLTDVTISANIAADTAITAINTATNTVTIDTPTQAASASGGDTLVTQDIIEATLYVPTLRQTYKIDNKVRLVGYRWSTDNQIYYQFTNTNSLTGTNPLVLNDTTIDYITYNDQLPDEAIVGNNIIYTTGGVVENICAPGAVAMTLWQSRLFMADAEDPNLIWYSKQVIESTPVEMSDLLTLYVAPTIGAQGSTGPTTALGAMDNNLIVFKKDAIYYINGAGPDNTGAGGTFSDPTLITSAVGCINPFSVVLTPMGIMFQSDKGIWLLGRDMSTTYVGAEVEDYTDNVLITSALVVPGTNQVRFTLNNGSALMYDYYFKLWGNWSDLPAMSAVINEGLHTYLTDYGQLVQETPGAYLDISKPVLISLTTGWYSLAGLQGFERFYSMSLLGQYLSPHQLVVELSYDYNPGVSQTITIDPINYTPPFGADPVYGDAIYGGLSNVERWRVFPERQKCSSFKISIREVFDASFGVVAGAGLTLSGMALLVGIKRGTRTQSANTSAG